MTGSKQPDGGERALPSLEGAVREVIEVLVMRPDRAVPADQLSAWVTLYDTSIAKLAATLEAAKEQRVSPTIARTVAEAERALESAGWDVWRGKTLAAPSLADRLRRLVAAYQSYVAAKYPRVAPDQTDAAVTPARPATRELAAELGR